MNWMVIIVGAVLLFLALKIVFKTLKTILVLAIIAFVAVVIWLMQQGLIFKG